MSDKKAAELKNSNQVTTPSKVGGEKDDIDPLSLQGVVKKSGEPLDLPNTSNARLIRRTSIQFMQRRLGNSFVSRFLAPLSRPTVQVEPPFVWSGVQREVGEAQESGSSGAPAAASPGPAAVPHATEAFYDVTGATLNDIAGQLHHFDGRYGAQTETQLGMSTSQVTPQRQPDGTLRVEVPWAITGAVSTLPNWTDYAQSCQAAQSEWDRFMRQTRAHEHGAHTVLAYQFVAALPESDRVITGRNATEISQRMVAKQQALRTRLQGEHDRCDHGVSIDAILHPDNGRCP